MKQRYKISISALIILSIVSSIPTNAESDANIPTDYSLIFEDHFNGTSLDTYKWSPINEGEGRLYNASQISVQDSNLKIKIEKTRDGVRSGWLTSGGRFKYKYGILDIKVKCASIAGCQLGVNGPADHPLNYAFQAEWYVSNTTYLNGSCRSRNASETIANLGVNRGETDIGDYCMVNADNLYQDYHIWQMEWNSTTVIFRLDGIEKWRYSGYRVPQDDVFVTMALCPQCIGWSTYNDTQMLLSNLPAEMYIDYVKVYQKNETTITNFQVFPNTSINYTKPAKISADITGDISYVSFMVIDNNSLIMKNRTAIFDYTNWSGINGKYQTTWNGRILEIIDNSRSRTYIHPLYGDGVNLGWTKDKLMVPVDFKKNGSTPNRTVVLWYNKTTYKLVNITTFNMSNGSTNYIKQIKIEPGNSIAKIIRFEFINGIDKSPITQIYPKTYKLYNIGDIRNPYLIHCNSPTGNYKVLVHVVGKSGEHNILSKDIKVLLAPITVIAPNGGEIWKRETVREIKWIYTCSSGSYVKIELLKNGVFNRLIASNTTNDGSFWWTIPSDQAVGNDYKIRITSTSNSAYKDISNNNFRIY